MSSADPAVQSPIPAAVKDLLALFDGPLAEVQFPEVDAKALRELAASVDAAAEEVEAAAQMWAAAKRAVDERVEALVQKSQRALAYARVYAEDKPEISAMLGTVMLSRAADARGAKNGSAEMAPARKRGRPKKGEAVVPAAEAAPPVVQLQAAPRPTGPVLLGASTADLADTANMSDAAPAAE